MDAKTREFLIKLQALLKEYDASVCWGCDDCSDMHGIYDEHMYVDVGDGFKMEGKRMKEVRTIVNNYGCYVTHQTIKELLSKEETMEIDETEGFAE